MFFNRIKEFPNVQRVFNLQLFLDSDLVHFYRYICIVYAQNTHILGIWKNKMKIGLGR